MRGVDVAAKNLSSKINNLFDQCRWEEARKILEREREQDPQSHWILTQLGVTFYEERRYGEALKIFQESLILLDDCPLTLWNLAGALDSLGKHNPAIKIYTWLLRSKESPEENPCWENREWADVLKADCVFRLGICFKNLGKKRPADHCFRQYANLLFTGIKGTYPIEDARQEIENLHTSHSQATMQSELRKVVHSTLKQPGIEKQKGRIKSPPIFSERDLLPKLRAASKK